MYAVLMQADVMVSSVSGNSEMAQAFTQDGPLDEGEMRAYDGDMGQLQCRVVVHLGIRTWSDADSTQVSDRIVHTLCQVRAPGSFL